MRIPALTRAPHSISRSRARQGAGSLGSASAGRQAVEPNRYAKRNLHPCASCSRGKHACNSIHCPCERCNPKII